jgi:hypothetical protein
MTGTIQRAILARINNEGYLMVTDVPEFRRSSVVRAALKLFKTGQIEPWTIHVDNRNEEYHGRPRTRWITIYVKPGLTERELARIRKKNKMFRHEILKNNVQK